MQIARNRRIQAVLGISILAMLALAIADRESAYMTMYVVGAILLLLGSAAGMGGGAWGPLIGREANPTRAFRDDMDQRATWLSHNFLVLLAGALLIGLGFLLNIA